MSKDLRILIVEDSAADAELLVHHLRWAGYRLEYQRVDSEEEMSAALQRQSWDLVISDNSMPRFSAIAALNLIKDKGLHLPFLVISGTMGEQFSVPALKAGAHDYLLKNDLSRLVPTIQRVLREAEIRRDCDAAEAALRRAEEEMETRVRDRTRKLEEVNRRMAAELEERKRAEASLQKTNEALARSLSLLESYNRRVSLLNELGGLLQTCLIPQEAYHAVAHGARELFPADSGAVFLLSPSHDLLETACRWGEASCGENVFAPEDCLALRRGHVHLANDAENFSNCPHLRVANPGTSLCIPMMAQSEALGLFHLNASAKLPPEEAEAKQRLAVAAADHLALALTNLRLLDKLRNYAIRDPLTGLFNRRYLEEALERDLHRAKRNESPVGILMLDVDYFKRFNDQWGHDAGDVLLKNLGHFLGNSMRPGDTVCRLGGEEFLAILPGASLDATRRKADEILRQAHELIVPYHAQILPCPTFSIGISAFPEHGSDAAALLKVADQALYAAKAKGRNCLALGSAAAEKEP